MFLRCFICFKFVLFNQTISVIQNSEHICTGLEQAMQAQKLTIAALDKELMFAKMPQEEYNRFLINILNDSLKLRSIQSGRFEIRTGSKSVLSILCRLQKELDATNASYSTQQTLCDNLRSQLGWISNK